MPSSYTSSLRFTLQFTGENINVWGDLLNAGVVRLADYAQAGWLTKALVGDYTLTTANGAADEARAAMLKFTGAGPFTVTIPSVSKNYSVWNACSAAVTLTTGAGTTATVQPGEVVWVVCDGANVKRVVATDYASTRITSVADPVSAQDAATKNYADNLAFTANAGILPGQIGNTNKLLGSGTTGPSPVAKWTALAASTGLTIAGTVDGGTFTWALDLNALSVKASPAASDYVIIYDVAGAAQKKALISTLPGNKTLIATSGVISGSPSTVEFKNLPATFGSLLVEFSGIKAAGGAVDTLINLSTDNGATYPVSVQALVSNGNFVVGAVRIDGYTEPVSTLYVSTAGVAALVSPSATVAAALAGYAIQSPAAINAISVTHSVGAFNNTGSITVFGL